MKQSLLISLLLTLTLGHLALGAVAGSGPEPTELKVKEAIGNSSTPAAPSGKKASVPAPAWAGTPDPSLPNVLILGDSISIGYTLQVRSLIQGKANVFRPLTPNGSNPANCEGTTLGVLKLDEWLKGQKWHVIYFNWGLHDLKRVKVPGSGQNSSDPADPPQADLEAYRRNLQAMIPKLKATGAKLIFATTTPVAPGTTNPFRDPSDPPRYNAAAISLMQSEGVRVHDLFAQCEPLLSKLQQPKNVHFTPSGSQFLAERVAAVIAEELR
ncbi:MAG: SGNH/GDSL hydrolase family protein [Verrucomicrobiales bacterium]|nr:SGNH/GDSL hydrolase family protein [Verrucomicrobiales bacterium]